jgi:hypothetical protein
MMKKNFAVLLLLAVPIWFCALPSCTNDKLDLEDEMEMPVDTVTGVVCHPDTLYFELEVLPILKSSCGRRDCHDTGTSSASTRMENYQTIMETGGIRPYMPEETKIFKQIIHPDEEERMPPMPYDRLTDRQIQIIAEWINNGAYNYRCDSSTFPCDTAEVSFSETISPIIEDACKGCHNQYVHEGNVELLTYEDIRTVALNGSLVGTVAWEPGYVRMPFGSIRLSTCLVEKISSWVEAGSPDN